MLYGIFKMVAHPLSNLFQRNISQEIDRDRPATQTASLIAASFRTWRGSRPSVARRPIRMTCNFSKIKPFRGNSAPHKADFGKRAPLAPRLAQPYIIIIHNIIFSREKNQLWQLRKKSYTKSLRGVQRPVCVRARTGRRSNLINTGSYLAGDCFASLAMTSSSTFK